MVATRGRLFRVFRNPRKALHLENKSSSYTPKSAGSALVIGKSSLVNTLPITKKNKHTVVTEAPKISTCAAFAARLH